MGYIVNEEFPEGAKTSVCSMCKLPIWQSETLRNKYGNGMWFSDLMAESGVCKPSAKSKGLYPHQPIPLPTFCSQCGVKEEESVDGFLFHFQVITQPGEEGYSDVTQLLCGDCLEPIRVGLIALGFKAHHHGSTDFLADPFCTGDQGISPCPSPHGYGPIVVGNPHLNKCDEED